MRIKTLNLAIRMSINYLQFFEMSHFYLKFLTFPVTPLNNERNTTPGTEKSFHSWHLVTN